VKGAITGAAGVRDVSVVAGRAVEGAIEAGKEVGANVEKIARVTLCGVGASRAVKEILVRVTEGAREIAGAAPPAGPAKGSSSHEATLPRKKRGSLKAHPQALKAKRLHTRHTSKARRTGSAVKGLPRAPKSPLHWGEVTNINTAAKKMTMKGKKGDTAFDVSTAAMKGKAKAGDTVVKKDGKTIASLATMGKARNTKTSTTKKDTGK